MTFEQEVAAEDVQARREAVELIKAVWDWRQAESNVKKELGKVDPSASDYGKMSALRRWLLEHDEPLYDEEHGLVAYLQPRSGGTLYADALEIKAKDPALYEKLATLGILQIDKDRMRDAKSRGVITAQELASWQHEVAGTPSLKVEKDTPAYERRHTQTPGTT